jgi:hypothetical protein
VVAQLAEDLLHLEGRGDGLDEHRRAHRAVRDPERALGVVKTSFHSAASRCDSILGR